MEGGEGIRRQESGGKSNREKDDKTLQRSYQIVMNLVNMEQGGSIFLASTVHIK